uniref:Sodium/hydrogen exchanger n=1 Tax=Esox lucius TaxID=8010 RepID=A0A6Q2YT61_ESOLU
MRKQTLSPALGNGGSKLSLAFQARNANPSNQPGTNASTGNGTENTITTLPIVTWKWHHTEGPYLVALWVLVSWICKLVFQLNPALTNVFPESGLLICIGWVLGGIIYGADKVQTFRLQPFTFFYYLLPPIVLDAGYSMPNKQFMGNLGAILVHAVIGTVWNAASLGLGLWGCWLGGAMGHLNTGLLQLLLFGSLIAAVDPVAVIAVFEEVHVNEVLYIIVFGESLLNDGVTVVLFNVFDAFVSLGGPAINAVEIIKGIISFFVVAFGGSLVGIAFGILISLLTRLTKKTPTIEPGFIFVFGYLSYLTAEFLSLSAILSCTFCGVFCQKYVNTNMSEKSVNTVRTTMKVFANGSETVIFVFLGISAIDPSIWVWNTGFILLTLLFIFVFRFMGVFVLTWILNQYRLVPLGLIEQLVMGYGGLRGAVAYGLVFLLDENKYKEKNLMISTTLLVVYFTVMLQGITMKPLVNWLKVKRATTDEAMLAEKIMNRTFDHMLVAIEDISGQIGHNYLWDKWHNFEEKWLFRILMNPTARKSRDYIFNIFHQLNLKDAMSYVQEVRETQMLREMLLFAPQLDDSLVHVLFCPPVASKIPTVNMLCFFPSRRDSVPSVSLNMHEQDQKMRESEDFNAHHLLQQHLYKGRKQRHTYSRKQPVVNRDEDEVQEIFQRTMRSRLESFKSAKMGVAQPKKITKHSKKDQTEKASCCTIPTPPPFNLNYFDIFAGFTSKASSYMAEMDSNEPMPPMPQIPPWLAEAGEDSSNVAPSQRAQLRLPWTPTNLRRLAPLRLSTHSNDSFLLADSPATQEGTEPQPPLPLQDGRGRGTHM